MYSSAIYTSSDRILTNFGLFWSLRLGGYNGGIFTILRPIDLEIFTLGSFVLFSTKFLLYGDEISNNEANSASCDPIYAELSLLERSHWDDHNGGKIVFLRAIGHVLSAFDVFDVDRSSFVFSSVTVRSVWQSYEFYSPFCLRNIFSPTLFSHNKNISMIWGAV